MDYGILIRLGSPASGRKVPHVPTKVDRYKAFKDRLANHTNEVPVNNYPWKWTRPENNQAKA